MSVVKQAVNTHIYCVTLSALNKIYSWLKPNLGASTLRFWEMPSSFA